MFRTRPFRPSDADAVWVVHEAALRASKLPFVDDPDTDRDLRAPCAYYGDGDATLLVGIDTEPDGEAPADRSVADGELVALAAADPVDDTTVEFRRLRVAPGHRRQGYARRLLDDLRARTTSEGFEAVVLRTDRRLTAARALYESRGYRRTDDGAEGRCEIEYRRSLGEEG